MTQPLPGAGPGETTAIPPVDRPDGNASEPNVRLGVGLTTADVAERVARGDVNDVPVRSSRSTTEIVKANVFTRFNAVIGVLWLIILSVGSVKDGLFGFVIIANTGIGIIQEMRAKRTLDRLAVIGESKPVVRRDGRAIALSPSELVLDDVIELGAGDKAAVDGVVVEADNLEIDESLLTGEADPVIKRPGDPVMSGSFVVAGNGAFTATRVGREAYAAQLMEEASKFTLVASELRNGISTILKYVTWILFPASIALIISQYRLEDTTWREAVTRMIAGIVPMVPEGLVLLTSLAFAVGVVRLGRKQCLVQELPAIEGLARVDVVCLDKTGTLTEGGMNVAEVRELAEGLPVRSALGALGTTEPRPNASLAAIIDECPAEQGWTSVESVPFSSARKYSGATFEVAGARATWLIGAPEVLVTTQAHGDLLGEAERLGAQGLRVLLLVRTDAALADAVDALVGGPDGADVTPAALVVLEQRLRHDAGATLDYFADQGVAAKVISGDNAISVGAVAAKLGIKGADHPVDARTLPTDQNELADVLEANTVFGRVTPQQKRDMVAALQSRGHNVAMTGDGVNDVLALKDADIGVSMGSGSEATKGVAQIVLLDNSFATLPSVVGEGRRVIGNIERVSNLFLTKTAYSVLLAILVVIANVPYPFLPRHLTLLAWFTIGTPAFFLALAPNKERARAGFVKRVLRYSGPSGVIAGTATFTAYLLARSHYGATDATRTAETSIATLTLFLVGLWVLAIIARPYTWWRIALVLVMGAGFALVLTVPWLQRFFELKLVGTQMPWTAVGLAVVAGLLLEVVAFWNKRRLALEVAAAGASSASA
ncbi:HAD-IC family P-type ATPase [Embleya sp. NPDC056575]|uniref:HAD-IC family P-type ATPase n=1 Tax=unclassified Embleya TaxID=2699296 RepID=UPI003692EB1B